MDLKLIVGTHNVLFRNMCLAHGIVSVYRMTRSPGYLDKSIKMTKDSLTLVVFS